MNAMYTKEERSAATSAIALLSKGLVSEIDDIRLLIASLKEQIKGHEMKVIEKQKSLKSLREIFEKNFQ